MWEVVAVADGGGGDEDEPEGVEVVGAGIGVGVPLVLDEDLAFGEVDEVGEQAGGETVADADEFEGVFLEEALEGVGEVSAAAVHLAEAVG